MYTYMYRNVYVYNMFQDYWAYKGDVNDITMIHICIANSNTKRHRLPLSCNFGIVLTCCQHLLHLQIIEFFLNNVSKLI